MNFSVSLPFLRGTGFGCLFVLLHLVQVWRSLEDSTSSGGGARLAVDRPLLITGCGHADPSALGAMALFGANTPAIHLGGMKPATGCHGPWAKGLAASLAGDEMATDT